MTRDAVDTQAADLIRMFLGLPPDRRLEVTDEHLIRAGMEESPEMRDKVFKLLAKLPPIHLAIGHLLMRAGTDTMAIDSRQLGLTFNEETGEIEDN
jgi:hypothetical protein